MPTEMELTLEQTQQGVSYEVSVDPYGSEGGSDSKQAHKIHSRHSHDPPANIKNIVESTSTMFQDFPLLTIPHNLSGMLKCLKLKNFKKDATLKLFKNGMSMSVQKSQVHKMAKLGLKMGKEIMLG
ncbi:hypothetical protein Tco_0943045 [Tanacetum coccineum]